MEKSTHSTLDDQGAAGPSRQAVLAGGATLAALAAGRAAAAEEAEARADFLFVQTAQLMAFDADRNRLTLRGVSPVTPSSSPTGRNGLPAT